MMTSLVKATGYTVSQCGDKADTNDPDFSNGCGPKTLGSLIPTYYANLFKQSCCLHDLCYSCVSIHYNYIIRL